VAPTAPVPYLLVYAANLAAAAGDTALRRYGFTVRQFGLLVQLALEPELTMSDLARQLGVARQSVHGLVRELEAAGHLTRAPGASGRSRRMVLTASTRRALNHAQRSLLRTEAALLAGLTPAETRTLRRLLQRLLAHATDDETWLV
jgi:DNA-binding MarR family transcriptional regulator